MLIILSLLMGIVVGLRAMIGPAAISWGAYLGLFDISQSSLSFMGSIWAVAIFTVLAIVELITDQLPSTPSRKVPMQFAARIIMGALSGATIASAGGMLFLGMCAGVIGAVIGTFGGAGGRTYLANRLGRDLPAALTEDGVAIALALLIVRAVP